MTFKLSNLAILTIAVLGSIFTLVGLATLITFALEMVL